jgi:hypothetical protein
MAHQPRDQHPDYTRRLRPRALVTVLVRTARRHPSPPVTHLPSLSTATRRLSLKPIPFLLLAIFPPLHLVAARLCQPSGAAGNSGSRSNRLPAPWCHYYHPPQVIHEATRVAAASVRHTSLTTATSGCPPAKPTPAWASPMYHVSHHKILNFGMWLTFTKF